MNTIVGSYINLERRTDRKQHIEQLKEKYKFLSKIERFNAINKPENPMVGCYLSHIKALEKYQNSNEDCVLILEDDFTIINGNNFLNFIRDFTTERQNPNWDLITLTPLGMPIKQFMGKESNFVRILRTQTTAGYIIKVKFIPEVLRILKEGYNRVMIYFDNREPHYKGINKPIYAKYGCDQYWKKLQLKHNFYFYKHVFASQLPGYSDINKKSENYLGMYIKVVHQQAVQYFQKKPYKLRELKLNTN